MSTKKIIVLGGSGFLGSNIIMKLLQNGFNQVFYGDLIPNKISDSQYLNLDILKRDDLVRKLGDFDIIINCIGQITHPFNLCLQLNTAGIENLAYAINKSNARLIHISTVSVYGSLESCNEDSVLNPETNYATAKAIAEYYLKDHIEENRLVILRISNLYGAYQEKGINAYLIRSYLSDKKLKFNNNGKMIRFFMHVSDCAGIIIEILKKKDIFGIFNVKGHDRYLIRELINDFESRFCIEFDKKFDEKPPWENITSLDDSKIQSLINYKFKWRFLDFIEEEINKKNYV